MRGDVIEGVKEWGERGRRGEVSEGSIFVVRK